MDFGNRWSEFRVFEIILYIEDFFLIEIIDFIIMFLEILRLYEY